MPQPIFDPNTGELIGYDNSADMAGAPWEGLSAAQAAAINTPPGEVPPLAAGPRPKGERKLIDQLNQLQLGRIAEQGRIADQSQRQLDLLQSQPTQLDVSPLVALSDAWSGGHMSQSYKAPETPVARQERLLALQGKVSQQRAGVTDEQRKLLEANIRDRLGEMRANNAEAMLRARMAQQSQGKPVPANLASELGGTNASIQALQDVQDLLQQNQDIAGPAAGRMSSLLATGQVGDRGKRAATYNAQLHSRAQIIGKYLEGGKLTDQDIERYKEQLPQLSDDPEVASGKIENLKRLIAAKQQAELAGLSQAGYNTSAIKGATVPAVTSFKGKGAAAAAPKRDYETMSTAELEALLGGK